MLEFNLSVGMTKTEVLKYAQNLNNTAKTKVINFFNHDDEKISHVNELAILNSIS